jgi:hypothetical protein
VIVWHNRYAIVWLKHETERRVVHKNRIFQSSVYHPQVLHVVTFFQSAMLPIQSMREDLIVRIQVLNDYISVRGATGCEEDNLSDLGKCLKELSTVGSDPDARLKL